MAGGKLYSRRNTNLAVTRSLDRLGMAFKGALIEAIQDGVGIHPRAPLTVDGPSKTAFIMNLTQQAKVSWRLHWGTSSADPTHLIMSVTTDHAADRAWNCGRKQKVTARVAKKMKALIRKTYGVRNPRFNPGGFIRQPRRWDWGIGQVVGVLDALGYPGVLKAIQRHIADLALIQLSFVADKALNAFTASWNKEAGKHKFRVFIDTEHAHLGSGRMVGQWDFAMVEDPKARDLNAISDQAGPDIEGET